MNLPFTNEHISYNAQSRVKEILSSLSKMADIHYSLNKVGYLAFAPDPFTTKEISDIDTLKVEYDDTGKTPQQRLRAVLYRLWEQSSEGYKDSNLYYAFKLEGLITHFKSKLI